MSWTIIVRCEHGVRRSAEVDGLGHVRLPEHTCEVHGLGRGHVGDLPARPWRLRIWWETRRLRRAMRRW